MMVNETIFYDTSILSTFAQLKRKDVFENLFISLGKKRFIKEDSPFVISTPLLLLELLGMGNAKKIINLNDHNEDIKRVVLLGIEHNLGIDEVVNLIYSIILGNLDKVESIRSENLLKVASEMQQFYNEWWKEVMSKIGINYLKDPAYSASLKHHLAMELIQDIEYENFLDKKSLTHFNTELMHYFYYLLKTTDENYVFSRRSLKYLGKKFPKEGAFISAGSDLVDSLIIHFSLVGYKNKGRTSSVKTFTCESKTLTRKRLILYYGALKHISDMRNDTRPLRFKPGTICHVCRRTGNVLGFTYVQKLLNEHMKNPNKGII